MDDMVCPICKEKISENDKYQVGDHVIHQLCKFVMCGNEELPGRVLEISEQDEAIVKLGTTTVAYHISQLKPYYLDQLTEEEIGQLEAESEEIV
jgi:hypothetical protein